jgi:hypothetical protein
LVVIALWAAVGAIAGCSAGASAGHGGSVESEGLRATLPAGWREVEANQPAQIPDPVVRFALASGPVRRVPSPCHVGAYAVPPAVAMVVVLEWRHTPPPKDGLRPVAASPEDLHLGKGNLECFRGRAGGLQASTGGRLLGIYVMLGDGAGPGRLDKAMAVIRSLHADGGRERFGGPLDTTGERGPFRLVSLPAGLGVVTWRCGGQPETHGLSYRPYGGTTTRVAFYLEGREHQRVYATDDPVDGALSRARRQAIVFVQRTGAGTLRATVRVDFGATGVAAPCYGYLPPRTIVTFGPRR